VYAKLISKKSILPAQTQQKWIEECNIEGGKCIEWYEANQLTPKCTKSTRLRVPKGFRASGPLGSGPGLQGSREIDQGLQAPLCFFALIQKQILELRKYSNFYF